MSHSVTQSASEEEASSAPATTAPAAAPMTHREILEAMSGLLLGMFVAILSSTVVSNALPTIVADLNGSESGYTWVVTSTLLATTISTPIWGKLADLFSKKFLVQFALVLFAAASMIAGLSQNMGMLITTRVFQGLGAGGLTALAQVIIASMVSPRERGRYSGYMGATFALATVAGPLIGGTITEHASWRWCFYVSVPFAVAAVIVLQLKLHLPVVKRHAKIDYLGALLLAGGISCLLIWVSLAGDKFDWGAWQTPVMVSGGIILLILTAVAESMVPEPMIPLRLFRSRVTVLASTASLFVGVAMFAATVFLGQYFQLARGDSPTKAGLMTLPMILGLVATSTLSGQLITRTGRWKIWLVSGGVLLTAGLGLLGTISHTTSFWQIAIWMFLVGAGLGMMMQNLVVAVQNEVTREDLGVASSFVAFTRTLGGAIGVSALGALLSNRVDHYMENGFRAAHINPGNGGGGTGIPDLNALPAPVRTIIESAYGDGAADVFLVATPFALLAFLITLFVKETSLRTGDATASTDANSTTAVTAAAPSNDEKVWNRQPLEENMSTQPNADGRGRDLAATGSSAVTGLTGQAADASAPADQTVEPSETGIYGVVFRGGNRPLVDAHITLLDQNGQQVSRTVSDVNGHYQFVLHHGGTYLMIVAADGVSPQASLVAVADRAVRRDVTLEGQGTITGRVLRHSQAGDKAVADALVTLTDVSGEVVGSAHTTGDGMYSFTNLVGGSYVLTAQSGQFHPQARLVELADGDVLASDLALSPGGRVTGVVSLARDQRPMAEATVTLVDEVGQVVAATTSGDDGRYVFENVNAGQYTLVATGFAPASERVIVTDDQVSTVPVALKAGLGEPGALQQAGRR